ncbi:MAG: hypothetical protein IPH31_03530 [Lewinellaceae bacterium]|nr:hypothetical protein [Lewinellaceae bacterium]
MSALLSGGKILRDELLTLMFKVVIGKYLRLFVQVFGLPFKTFEPTDK